MVSTRSSNLHSGMSLFTVCFMLLYLVAQIYVNPYRSADLNQVDSCCTIVQILTILASLFIELSHLSEVDENRVVKICAVAVLLIIYVCFGIMFYLHCRIEIVKWLIKNEWNGRFVTCLRTLFFGHVNVSRFRRRYMTREMDPREKKSKGKSQIRNVEMLNSTEINMINNQSALDESYLTDHTERAPNPTITKIKNNLVDSALEYLPSESMEVPVRRLIRKNSDG